MTIVKIEDGTEVSETEVRAKFGLSREKYPYLLTRTLENLGYTRPRDADVPAILSHQELRKGNLSRVGGAWVRGWKVIDLTAADMPRVLADRVAKLGELRRAKETGGLDHEGMLIRTDDKTVSRLLATDRVMGAGYLSSVSWRMADGNYAVVDHSAISDFLRLATAHIAACFDAEAKVTEELEAKADIETLAAYDFKAAFEQEYDAINATILAASANAPAA